MTLIRYGALGCALLVAVGFTGNLAGQQRQPFQFGRQATGPLVSADLATKLDLTSDQKAQIEKIEKEYADKTADAQAKLKEAREQLTQNMNREALTKIRELTQEVQKTRTEYGTKVEALLTEAQKKTYTEATQARRPGLEGFQFGRTRADLSSKATQDRLNLTAEQREQIEKLQKEFEAKTLEVLTKEQQEQFEELKKARPGRPQTPPSP